MTVTFVIKFIDYYSVSWFQYAQHYGRQLDMGRWFESSQRLKIEQSLLRFEPTSFLLITFKGDACIKNPFCAFTYASNKHSFAFSIAPDKELSIVNWIRSTRYLEPPIGTKSCKFPLMNESSVYQAFSCTVVVLCL